MRFASRGRPAVAAVDPDAEAPPLGDPGSSDDSTRSFTRTADEDAVGGCLRFLSPDDAGGALGRADALDPAAASLDAGAAAMGTPMGADILTSAACLGSCQQ